MPQALIFENIAWLSRDNHFSASLAQHFTGMSQQLNPA